MGIEGQYVLMYLFLGKKINAPGLPMNVVLILPETNSFKYKDSGGKTFYISRAQLPLVLAYAFTANKI